VRKRRRILLAALIAIVVSGIACLTIARSRTAFSPPGELVLEEHFEDYQVKIYRDNEDEGRRNFFSVKCFSILN
jgi:hypothetical protein